jgi:hypothetical protein
MEDSLRYFFALEKRPSIASQSASKKRGRHAVSVIQQGQTSVTPPLNRTTRAGHPSSVTGIARSSPKRLQYAIQNAAHI